MPFAAASHMEPNHPESIRWSSDVGSAGECGNPGDTLPGLTPL